VPQAVSSWQPPSPICADFESSLGLIAQDRRRGASLDEFDSLKWGQSVARNEYGAGISPAALEILFDLSPDAVLAVDEGGVIREANSRAVELFGYPRRELIGISVETLVPERFRGSHGRHREDYNARPRMRPMGAAMNLFALRADGTEFPIDVMLKPMHSTKGIVALSFVRDASEQKAATETIRRHEQQLRSIVEGVRDFAIYLLDRHGKVLTWNPGAEQLMGYTAEEIIGTNFSRLYTQEEQDQNRPVELLRKAAQQESIEEQTWRLRKDGSRFWADIVVTAIRDSGDEVAGFAIVTRDSTDRKQAEEALMLPSVLPPCLTASVP